MAISKVSLRRRPIKNAKESLYLDFYPPIRNTETMVMSRREYLGIYIYARPTTEIQREYNDEMLNKAEIIRSIRQRAIINEKYDFLDKNQQRQDFLLYFYDIAATKEQKWLKVYSHFVNFVKNNCTVGDVTVELCRKFREYLLVANQLQYTHLTISQNSAASYYSTFRALLKVAHRDKIIRENINEYLERIDSEDVKKEFLTLDELKKLSKTECESNVLKRASLFACLTGLRISDIIKLQWKEIVLSPDGGHCMRLKTQKTDSEVTLPISAEALAYCGERGERKVFKGFNKHLAQAPMQRWLKLAGIDKKITFHCFRHTFATLQIALGTDIYTVSKMLTHKNVTTTQIYAELVSEKKRESSNRITLKD